MTKAKRLEIAIKNSSEYRNIEIAKTVALRRNERVLTDGNSFFVAATRDAIKMNNNGFSFVR